MNNPFNHLTNLALSMRSLPRLGLLVLAGLMTLGAAQLSPSTTSPTPTVQEVLPPTPPGTEPGSQMFLQATVTGRGLAEVTFYLSEKPWYNGDDVGVGSVTASSGTVGVAGLVPQNVPPGFYYLLACISRGTIQIIGQALSAVDPELGYGRPCGPPLEYFPERTAGMKVGSPFPCPISAHGQYPSSCVWGTTQNLRISRTGFAPASTIFGVLIPPAYQ
jgi:hypothetical protein